VEDKHRITNMNMMERLKHARRVSVPLVSLTTADPMAAMRIITKKLNGDSTPVVMCRDDVRCTFSGPCRGY
jgi:hypothetical protein